jgi:hypothetical protein
VRRRWRFPVLLLAAGVVLAASGVTWAVAAGIALPDPDPAAEAVAYAAFHHEVVNALLLAGASVFAVGLVWLSVRGFRARRDPAGISNRRGRP